MENYNFYAYRGDKYLYKYLFKQDKINKQTEKTTIKKSKKISAIFQEIVSLKNITFKIVNEEVLKIENGEIISLKVVNTKIEFKYTGEQYILHVFIKENDLINIPDTFKNPNTGTGISIIIIFMLIISLLYILYSRERRIIS